MLRAPAFPCRLCGSVHSREPGFRWPDAVFAIPEDERATRLVGDEHAAVIDGRAFFIRCSMPIPLAFDFGVLPPSSDPADVMRNEGTPFSIGFWLQVREHDYRDYMQYFVALERGHQSRRTYEGRIANQWDLAGGATLGARVRGATTDPAIEPISPEEWLVSPERRRTALWGHAPRLVALDGWLAALQQQGLSAALHQRWMERCAHPDEPELAVPPWTAKLAHDGWEVLGPETTRWEPFAFRHPPPRGDFVKMLIAFASADEDGDAHVRNAGWWVRLDDASTALWTGTVASHPPTGAPLSFGTRVWFPPHAVIAHQRPP